MKHFKKKIKSEGEDVVFLVYAKAIEKSVVRDWKIKVGGLHETYCKRGVA